MDGKLINYDVRENQGIIEAADGTRHPFAGADWRALELPRLGMPLSFVPLNGVATEICSVAASAIPAAIEDNPGLYRSTTDKMLSGVCGGLAHKFKVSAGGLRVATVITSIFIGLPLIAYLVFWIVLPKRPTNDPV